MEAAITIREIQPADASAVVALQSQCPELAQWPQHEYEQLADCGMAGWIAVGQGTSPRRAVSIKAPTVVASPAAILGFLIARCAADELEILNVAVGPESRRRGAGRALLAAALSWGKSRGATRAHLEVRASNQSAIAFYASFGFHESSRRLNYYSNPTEDALVLAAPIG